MRREVRRNKSARCASGALKNRRICLGVGCLGLRRKRENERNLGLGGARRGLDLRAEGRERGEVRKAW